MHALRSALLRSLLGLLLAAGCLSSPAAAATLNVPSQFTTIQAAVTAAQNGDTVLLASGTYTGMGNVDVDFGGKNITITSVSGPASAIINCNGSSATNHRGFYIHSGETNAVLSGLTIENGYVSNANNDGNGTGGSGDAGGAIFSAGGLTVQNCVLQNNSAYFGGGLFNTGSITVTGCAFTGNSAVNPNLYFESGGGMENNDQSANPGVDIVVVSGCTFTNNMVGNSGGGIYNVIDAGAITVTACTFTSNSGVNGEGDGGGGLDNINEGPGSITVTNCAFTSNTTHNGGGGLYNENRSTGSISITACAVENNTTTPNGSSNAIGGGILDDNTGAGSIAVTNCVVAGNAASVPAGSFGGFGGGVFNEENGSGSIRVTNCTVAGNSADNTFGNPPGGGIYDQLGSSPITDANDILYSNQNGQIADSQQVNNDAPSVITHCDIQSGSGPGSTASISLDPLFVNASGGDYHLQPGSPCLGAGLAVAGVTTDKDGVIRPNPPSIGAYELPAAVDTSHAQLLWNKTDGTAALWNINPDGSYASVAYGPYSGWTARAVSEAPDGADWLLWTNTSGEASLWRVSALTANGYSTVQYGPYTGYQAVSLSIGSDGNPRLLWNETNGVASLWDINKSTGGFPHTEYGPYAGWTANQVASGTTVTDLLWTNTNGQAAGWRIAADGSLKTSAFGPYSGYSCVSLSVGSDDGAHLLWDSASGSEALWSADFTTGAFTAASYGPFSSYSARAIATGPDGGTRMLWDNTNGTASLWDVTSSGFTHQEFGPFSGWTAVAVSAGP